jgi:hypothetical protein
LKRFIDEKERRIRDRIIFHISKKLRNIEKRGERNGRVEEGVSSAPMDFAHHYRNRRCTPI